MAELKTLSFVVDSYPTDDNPACAFVKPIACAFADMGVACHVIAPQSVTKRLKGSKKLRPKYWEDVTDKGNKVRIYQPYFISLGNRKIFGYNPVVRWKISAIKKTVKKYGIDSDAVYAHFWGCGINAAAAFGNKTPVVVANGESTIWVRYTHEKKYIDKYLSNVKGVINLSNENHTECEKEGLLVHNPKTVVLPNGVNTEEFFRTDRATARKKINISDDETVAVFVGAFSERKGIDRVLAAAKKVPGLKLILIGKGKDIPQNDQIVFCGSLPHEQINTYLNAADFFVLPTLAEGCCNAIVEAVCCGLPVISSNLPFNEGVLDETNALLIDPSNVDEIASAMEKLYSDAGLRESLSRGSVLKTPMFDVKTRISKMKAFIEECME